MRLPGYCEKCRKFKNGVRVSPSRLATSMARGGTPTGICSWCEDEPNRKRREAARQGEKR